MNTTLYARRLEEEKAKLEAEMGTMGRRNPGVPDDWEAVPTEIGAEADLADQADVVMHRDSTTAIFADLEARYDAVLMALSRIKDKKYGMCEVCGKTIEEARLNADPAASTCVLHL
jgi:DnaK suppressor protein